ncbi:MAG: hypothetical protein ABEH47_05180 [Haloferacaceae archaeon]
MLSERAERLARFCRERARANLRIVVGYGAETYVIAHIRDDLRDRYTGPEVERMLAALRNAHDDLWVPAFIDSAVGPPKATVHYFGDAVVVQLLVDADHGFVASFDREASPTLAEFVEECRMRVSGEMAG